MLRVEEAEKIILETLKFLGEETVSLTESLGRVLAEDVYSQDDIPPFDTSAMDGYAVRSQDLEGATQENQIILEVVEDIPAGVVGKREIHSGEAARIMTGAPIPSGADAVVMVEYTRTEQKVENKMQRVKIFKEVKSGENIRRAGEDMKKEELVLKKGKMIGPTQLGVLARIGKEKVKVGKKPSVGILATGDELVEVKETIGAGKIRNSNTYSLFGQVKEAGGIPYILGIARDNKKEIRAKIEEGLNYDLLLISGGISVGDYDYVKDVLSEMGADIKFWKVAMRPGKPLAFGIIKDRPIFGLPGNPVSSMISFEVFVRPAILKMLGQNEDNKKEVVAILEEDIKKKKGFRYFLRAKTIWKDRTYFTRTTGPQGSGILKSIVKANSLIILPEDMEYVERGTKVRVKLWN